MSDAAAKRTFTELNKVNLENQKNPNSKKFIIDENPFDNEDGESPALEQDGNDEYFVVVGRILPTSSPYNKSAYKAKLKIPTSYPFKPPQFEIITPMYHPNIGPEGKLCLPLLRHSGTWKSTNSLFDVFQAVIDHIDNPNITEAVSADIANEYTKNRAEFDRKAIQTIEKNMVPRQ